MFWVFYNAINGPFWGLSLFKWIYCEGTHGSTITKKITCSLILAWTAFIRFLFAVPNFFCFSSTSMSAQLIFPSEQNESRNQQLKNFWLDTRWSTNQNVRHKLYLHFGLSRFPSELSFWAFSLGLLYLSGAKHAPVVRKILELS